MALYSSLFLPTPSATRLQSMKRSIELRRNKYAKEREAMSAPWMQHDATTKHRQCTFEGSIIFTRYSVILSVKDPNGAFEILHYTLKACRDPRISRPSTCQATSRTPSRSFKPSVAVPSSRNGQSLEASMPNLHSPKLSGGSTADNEGKYDNIIKI